MAKSGAAKRSKRGKRALEGARDEGDKKRRKTKDVELEEQDQEDDRIVVGEESDEGESDMSDDEGEQFDNEEEGEEEGDEDEDGDETLPVVSWRDLAKANKAPRVARTEGERAGGRNVLTVVLEGACLNLVKSGKHPVLLNSDDHMDVIRKRRMNPNDARPDITHQCLLTLLDSPLNKAGLLRVFIHTQKNQLIEVNPKTRIPRTFKRFAGLIAQLMQKLVIRAAQSNEKLLSLIKNPVTDHFPTGARVIGTSRLSTKLVDVVDYVQELPNEQPIVFVVGAMAHGKVEAGYIDEEIAVSEYALSGSVVCGKVCYGFERRWNII